MALMFRRMMVAGVGIIGGSLALAARRYGLVKEVYGYGRGEKNLRTALRRGLIDGYFMHESEIPDGVDHLVLATPVQSIVSLAKAFVPRLKPGCLISDVGSVKGGLVREVERVLPQDITFVGAHPIAGGEQWGAQAAVPDLFKGHRCILTPTQTTDSKTLKKLSLFWRRLGARVEIMDPQLHDHVLALVSHLPHVVAYALVNTLGRAEIDGVDIKQYCGRGFKDITRIASSRPEIWRDICLVNRRAISKFLRDYIKCLGQLNGWIRDGKGSLLEREFARANELRRGMS